MENWSYCQRSGRRSRLHIMTVDHFIKWLDDVYELFLIRKRPFQRDTQFRSVAQFLPTDAICAQRALPDDVICVAPVPVLWVDPLLVPFSLDYSF